MEFNHQLNVLAEPLGALYEKTSKQYAGIFYHTYNLNLDFCSQSLLLCCIFCFRSAQR